MLETETRFVLENIQVLVLDDNRHMRNLVREIFHAFGIKNVHLASDAAQAFKELKHFRADIIITDWHMEPLDGLEFVRLIRTTKDSPNPYVPIIMLSGYTEYIRVVEARDAGVNEYIAKPVSAAVIYQRVASLISHPRDFIRTKAYFGPDRHRQNFAPPRGTSDRREEVAPATPNRTG